MNGETRTTRLEEAQATVVRRSRPLRVALVTRGESGTTGTERYGRELGTALRAQGVQAITLPAALPLRLAVPLTAATRLGVDLRTFLGHYPLTVPSADADLYHLTSQNLATLLVSHRFDRPTVLTVHDIIPHLVRWDPLLCTYRHRIHRWFDRLAIAGIRRATAIVADSAWTKRSLVTSIGVPSDRIHVAHLGVDHARFRPQQAHPDVLARYGLDPHARYLLYVGSDDPRKNLVTLVRAFALATQARPGLHLVMVGATRDAAQHQRLQELARGLGIADAVSWLGALPEADLPMLYGAATAAVVPSRYEGFGLPVAEAMACGAPVICSDASSLPEVAAGAAYTVPALDVDAFAHAILSVIDDPSLGRALAAAGIRRAASLTWSSTAAHTVAAYQQACPRATDAGWV